MEATTAPLNGERPLVCLGALARAPDGRLYPTDGCEGFTLELRPKLAP